MPSVVASSEEGEIAATEIETRSDDSSSVSDESIGKTLHTIMARAKAKAKGCAITTAGRGKGKGDQDEGNKGKGEYDVKGNDGNGGEDDLKGNEGKPKSNNTRRARATRAKAKKA